MKKIKLNNVEFTSEKKLKPEDIVSILCHNEMAIQSLLQDPMSAVEREKGIDVWLHYSGEPVLRPGIAKTIGIHLEKNGKALKGDVSIIVPRGWTINKTEDKFGQKRFILYADKINGHKEVEVKVKTGSDILKTSFVILGPDEAKGYPVNTQAGRCPKCNGWIGKCLCKK